MPSLKEKNPATPTDLTESALTLGPAEISAEELHDLLFSAAVMVVDVRPAEEYSTVHIPKSVNKPFQELDYAMLEAEVVAHAKADAVVLVFVSAQSPDVDDLAAREYINAYAKKHAGPPPEDKVRILLGGVCNWVERYPA